MRLQPFPISILVPAMTLFRFWLLVGCWVLASWIGVRGATLPTGFVEQEVGSGWSEAVGLAFGKNADGTRDRVYVWERTGRVWIVENGVKLSTPLLDISEEVGGWRDYGMLGFALDPNFQTNGHFYVLYVVDRHHLMKFGTAQYSATTNEYFAATIGRLTRYTARRADDFRTADPASRKVLIGETKSTGFPLLHHTHGTGSLVFGTDGTLLAACGDGASPWAMDNGGTAGDSNGPQALADGIITPAEDIGAFRCQQLDSLSGKIVRIDPATGDGVASNPWYQSGAPRSARSRVWAYGLRNPMRMTLKPGTGQHDPAAGSPGVLYIGDVGWLSAEDLEVADRPGQNFGWPLYEGYNQEPSYWNARPAGMNATDWVKPRAAWRGSAFVLTPGGALQGFGAAGTTVPGPNFGGNCSIGGVWYSGTDFPAEWRNVYFHAEYGGQWIRAFSMDAAHFVTGQRTFLTGAPVTCVATHPETGGLYYVTWGGGVKKISYAPTENQPPTAVATVSHTSGASPLAVAFSSLGSRDPENGALTYAWDFGDGTTSAEAHPVKTYTASSAQAFTATLTVRDAANATATASVVVTVNNTAPTVVITSPPAGATFPISGPAVTVPLTAAVTAPGHAASALSYRWQTFLYHNTHFHGEPEQTTATGSLILTPLPPTAADSYFYKVVLTVTDPLGARSTAERILLPAGGTTGTPPFAALGTPPPVVGAAFAVPVTFSKPVTGLVAGDFTVTNGTASALGGSGAVYSLTVTPAAPGPVTISLPGGSCVDAENLTNAAGLPVSTFFLPAPLPITPAPGLKGEYFSSDNFGTLALTRIDPRLEFYWPDTTSPGPGVPGDYFSARWTGRLTVPASGSWQFFADVDDGLRLWVNGQLLLDKWNPPPAVYWGLASTPITLTAGIAYDFKVEYQDFYSDSYLVLRWAGPGTPQQVVPATAFAQPTGTVSASVAASTEDESSDPLLDASAQAAMTATFQAAQADLPRLGRTLAAVPQEDGSVEIQFTRSPAFRLATVLQASNDMTHWHDIRDPGWPVTVLSDGMEAVRVPRACCLLSGHDGAAGYFRLRAGP